MQTQRIELEPKRARELWRDYRKHQHWSEPIDQEVMRIYQALAQGKLVIKALESITAAGLNAESLPKLAIARADAQFCWLHAEENGAAVFATDERALTWQAERMRRRRVALPRGSFNPPIARNRWRPRAIVPQVPLPLRPKRGLENYHVLWEAEWTLVPPVDPMLLRRVGEADLWIVCAVWNLTEVERMALSARVHA